MPQKRQFERPTCGEPRMGEKGSLDGVIHVIHTVAWPVNPKKFSSRAQ